MPRLKFSKGFAPILVVLILGIIGIVAYFMLKPQTSSLYPSPTPTQTPEPTASWKTFSSSNNTFSFKYPENLYVLYERDDYILFFLSEQEAEDAMTCLDKIDSGAGFCDKNELNNLVLNIGVTIHPKSGYTTLKEKHKQPNQGLPVLVNYIDPTGRDWTVLGPIAVPGASNIEAEATVQNTIYDVSIQIGEQGLAQYLGRDLVPKDSENIAYQILSTFKFLNNQLTPTPPPNCYYDRLCFDYEDSGDCTTRLVCPTPSS